MPTERSVLVRLKADVSDFKRGMREAADSIDTTNDRTAWLAQSFLALGPTLAPIGAAAVPVFTTIATQATLAGTAVVSLGLAFNGVGDALGALNDFQLEPTEANLLKLNEAMDAIGPAGEEFVRFLDEMGPALSELANNAREGMFPGMTEGLESLIAILPTFNTLISRTSQTLGELSASGGKSLAGPEFAEFFEYLSTDGQQILSDMGRTLGNFFQGFASMMVAFGPLTGEFSAGLRGMSEDFAAWAAGLDQSESFQDFLDYIRESGPKVLDLMGALVGMLVQLAEAAAPVGDIMVPALTDLLKVVTALLDNPIAPWFIAAGAAIGLYGRAQALLAVTTGGFLKPLLSIEGGLVKQTKAARNAVPALRDFGNTAAHVLYSTELLNKGLTSTSNVIRTSNARALEARASVGAFAKSIAPATLAVGLLGVQASGAADKVGLQNTATLALMGSIGGPPGAIAGGLIGLMIDAASAQSDWSKRLEESDRIIRGGSIDERISDIRRLRQEMAQELTFGSDGVQGDALPKLGNFGVDATDKFRSGTAKLGEAEAALARLRAEAQKKFEIAGLEPTVAGLEQATLSTEEFTASLIEAREVLSDEATYDSYEAALDNVTESLQENGRTLDANTEKGRNNRAALRELASQILDVAVTIDDPILRSQFMEKARRQFINARVAAGDTREEARKLAKQLGLVHQSDVTIKVNDKAVRDALVHAQNLKNLLAGIGLNDLVPPNLRMPSPPKGTLTPADGMFVPKTGLPYADRHPALLADGEAVISNRYGQVDRNAGLLKAINDNRYAEGRVPGVRGYIRDDLNMPFPQNFRQWNAALAASTKFIEKEKSAREDLLSRRDQTSSSVRDAFRSDLFGDRPEGWSWMSASDRSKSLTGDPFSILSGDISKAGEFQKYLKTLKSKGLDGGAFAALAETGDLEQAKAFAGMSKADIARYENLFKKRESLSAGVGAFAGQAAFGPLLAANAAQMREAKVATAQLKAVVGLLRKNPDATGAAIAKAINGAGPNNPRRGK